MGWKKQLTLNDNEIYLGSKPPMNYAFSIASLIKKHGECWVSFEPDEAYLFQGNKRTLDQQWKDVSRFLSDGFNTKIVKDATNNGIRKILLTW